MYKVILTLVALAPLALAGAPALLGKRPQRAASTPPRQTRHACAVAELAQAMREAEALAAVRPARAHLRLAVANG